MIKCDKCGASLPNDSIYCTSCGAKVEAKRYCQYCGKEIHATSRFCTHCGKQVQNATLGDQVKTGVRKLENGIESAGPEIKEAITGLDISVIILAFVAFFFTFISRFTISLHHHFSLSLCALAPIIVAYFKLFGKYKREGNVGRIITQAVLFFSTFITLIFFVLNLIEFCVMIQPGWYPYY